MGTRTALFGLLVCLATFFCAAASGSDIVWTGTGGGIWSDAGSWSGGSVPGSSDTAVFSASGTAVTSAVDQDFTNQVAFVKAGASDGGSVTFNLENNLKINAGNTKTSGLLYASEPAGLGIVWNLNGCSLDMVSKNGDGPKLHVFYGEYRYNEPGSRIRSTMLTGTGGSDYPVFDIGGDLGNAFFNVTADGVFGQVTEGTHTTDSSRTMLVNIWTGSVVRVSGGAAFDICKRMRVGASGRCPMRVNNYGIAEVDSESGLNVVFQQVKAENVSVYPEFINCAGGLVEHAGMVGMDLCERGTNRVFNSGVWRASESSVQFKGLASNSGGGDYGTMVFVNDTNGVFCSEGGCLRFVCCGPAGRPV